MTTTVLYLIILGMFILGALITAIAITRVLNKSNSIDLIQGRLENSDLSIADVTSYLKITNEWSEEDDPE